MGILDMLMSADPMVSARRRGILEMLAPLTGKQPIAPTMGQIAGAVSAGSRQGKKNFMADQMTEFQYKKATSPNVSFQKGADNSLIAIKTPQLFDDGKPLSEQVEFETISKGKTSQSFIIGNEKDEEALLKVKPGFNSNLYREGTVVTIDKNNKLSFSEPSKKGLSQANTDKNNSITNDRKFIDREFAKYKKIQGNEDSTMLDFYSEMLNKTAADKFSDNPNYVPELKRIISNAMNMKVGVEDKDLDKYQTAFAGVNLDGEELNVDVAYEIANEAYGDMTLEEIIAAASEVNSLPREEIIKQLIESKIIKAK